MKKTRNAKIGFDTNRLNLLQSPDRYSQESEKEMMTSELRTRRWSQRSAFPIVVFGITLLALNRVQGFSNQLHPSVTDAWDISNGAIVNSSTGVQSGSDPQD